MTAIVVPPLTAVIVAAAGFSGTIGLGSVVVLFATVFAAAWINARRKSDTEATAQAVTAAEKAASIAQDAAEAWKLERDAEVAKNGRLLNELTDERKRCTDALTEVAKLQERTDVTQLAATMENALATHERGAKVRSVDTLEAIHALPGKIAEALAGLPK